MTGLRPPPNTVAEPSTTLAFTVRTGDEREIDPAQVAVSVDGRDVTSECAVRLPRLWPANRADYAYCPAGGWAAGRHEVSVAWDGAPLQAWHFDVVPRGATGL